MSFQEGKIPGLLARLPLKYEGYEKAQPNPERSFTYSDRKTTTNKGKPVRRVIVALVNHNQDVAETKIVMEATIDIGDDGTNTFGILLMPLTGEQYHGRTISTTAFYEDDGVLQLMNSMSIGNLSKEKNPEHFAGVPLVQKLPHEIDTKATVEKLWLQAINDDLSDPVLVPPVSKDQSTQQIPAIYT